MGLIMKNKQTIAIIISLTLFLIILVSLTDIILVLPQKGYFLVKKSDISRFESNNSNVYSNIDFIVQNEDVRKTIEITGYAYYTPSKSNLETKEVILFFHSPENTYSVRTDLTDRFDLRAIFSKSDVIGFKHGFRTVFSPLGMRNGTYRLYIYCFEDNENFGFIPTGRDFIKTYTDFYELKENGN